MAEEPQSICEWLDIDLNRLSGEDRVALVSEICDELTVPELRTVMAIAEEKRAEKLEGAKNEVIAEMRDKFEQLDLDFDEVMGYRRRRRGKSNLPPKYRSPEGKEWSGRGMPPQWIRDYEEEGGDREDYRIADETEVN